MKFSSRAGLPAKAKLRIFRKISYSVIAGGMAFSFLVAAAPSGRADSLQSMQMLLSSIQNNHGPDVLGDRVQRWAAVDYPAALAWVSTFQAGAQRDAMVGGLCLALAQNSPRDAALLAVEQIPAGAMQDQVLMVVTHQWGPRNLADSRKWLARFGSPWKDRAVLELLGKTRHPISGDGIARY